MSEKKPIEKAKDAKVEQASKLSSAPTIAQAKEILFDAIVGEATHPHKLHDMIVYYGMSSRLVLDPATAIIDLIKPFFKEERAESVKRFGITKFGLRLFSIGGVAGWSNELSESIVIPFQGYKGLCRNYRSSPEFLPAHFTWEVINPEAKDTDQIYGGSLKNGSNRTADLMDLVGQAASPRF